MSALHDDLQAYVQAGALNHPLVIMRQYAEQFAPIATRMYLDKRRELDRAEQTGDWLKYIWLHERPYQTDALVRVSERLSDEVYWRAVRDVWRAAPRHDRVTWTRLWTAKRPYREQTASEAERRAIMRLPDIITIYRGASTPRMRSLSWTTRRDLALVSAHRSTTPFLGTANVNRTDVLAYFVEDSEIVVLPKHVQNLVLRDLRSDRR